MIKRKPKEKKNYDHISCEKLYRWTILIACLIRFLHSISIYAFKNIVLISTTTTLAYTNISDIIEVLPLVMLHRQHPDMVTNHGFRWPLPQLPFQLIAVKLYTCMVSYNLQQHLRIEYKTVIFSIDSNVLIELM